MANKHLVDIVYDIAKEKHKDKTFTFDEVWKNLIKEAKLSKDEQATLKGTIYTDLLQDARFIYAGNRRWHLREYILQDEIDNLQHALYDFEPIVPLGDVKTNDDNEDLMEEEEMEKMFRGDVNEEDEEIYDEMESSVEQHEKKEEE